MAELNWFPVTYRTVVGTVLPGQGSSALGLVYIHGKEKDEQDIGRGCMVELRLKSHIYNPKSVMFSPL